MAVESRFVVIRHGAEVKTFMDKKSADEYDRMLDMADNLAEVFAESPIELSETIAEELSIYLAQKREEVLVALLAKKPAKAAAKRNADKPSQESKLASVTAESNEQEPIKAIATEKSPAKRKAKSA